MSDVAVEATKPAKQYRSSEELEMRGLVVPELRKRWPDARIVHEFPLRYSARRIDLAAIRPTEIISVEIKSSRDVADRLEAQLRAFVPISSRVIVALAPKWNEKLPAIMTPVLGGTQYTLQYTPAQRAIRAVNKGEIETWTVDAASGSIYVTENHRAPQRQPWLAQMLDVLHVGELERIAARHRISIGKRSTHRFMRDQCANLMTGREIVAAVCAALRARPAFAAGSDAPIEGAA